MWIYQGKEFKEEDIPEGAIGFVYEMGAIIDGKSVRYIGKKDFYHYPKTKLAKKDMPTDKRLKDYVRKQKVAYKNYYSSNTILKIAKMKGIVIKREILRICYSKSELTYMECKYMFAHGVLESNEFLNGNILGRFYQGKIGL